LTLQANDGHCARKGDIDMKYDDLSTALAGTGHEDAPSRSSHRRTGAVLSRLVSTKIAPAAVIGAALLMFSPAAAQAGPASATVTLGSDLFPTGTAIADGVSGTIPVSPGSSVTLTAPQYLYQPPTATDPSAAGYDFMFWDVNSTLITTAEANFTVPAAGGDLGATAWYAPMCVEPSSCGGGASYVTTWAFSLTADEVLPGTPIQSVAPGSAWTSPSTTVSTATAVNINALPYLGAHTKYSGSTVFSSWLEFGGTGTVSGLVMQVPQGESPYGVAFYNQYKPFTKPICIGYPHCI
jgi:hypothetical protein